jgi:hypothetical protein
LILGELHVSVYPSKRKSLVVTWFYFNFLSSIS